MGRMVDTLTPLEKAFLILLCAFFAGFWAVGAWMVFSAPFWACAVLFGALVFGLTWGLESITASKEPWEDEDL